MRHHDIFFIFICFAFSKIYQTFAIFIFFCQIFSAPWFLLPPEAAALCVHLLTALQQWFLKVWLTLDIFMFCSTTRSLPYCGGGFFYIYIFFFSGVGGFVPGRVSHGKSFESLFVWFLTQDQIVRAPVSCRGAGLNDVTPLGQIRAKTDK